MLLYLFEKYETRLIELFKTLFAVVIEDAHVKAENSAGLLPAKF